MTVGFDVGDAVGVGVLPPELVPPPEVVDPPLVEPPLVVLPPDEPEVVEPLDVDFFFVEVFVDEPAAVAAGVALPTVDVGDALACVALGVALGDSLGTVLSSTCASALAAASCAAWAFIENAPTIVRKAVVEAPAVK